jgi:hypothetical protein
MMFEGGSESSGSLSEYEGGSGDEGTEDLNEDGAETVKPKGKKKKKKAAKKSDTLKSKPTTTTSQKLDESAYNPDTQGDTNPL